MNFLNIHTDLLRSADYLGTEPVERATWLNLMAWCASQENGGVIAGAVDWPDRKWQQVCGVTLEEVTEQTGTLYYFNDDGDLIVHHYPTEKELEVIAKRDGGRKGGGSTTDAKKKAVRENGRKGGRPPKNQTETKNLSLNQSSHPEETKAETKRKGREGKDKGMERKGGERTREETSPENQNLKVLKFPLPPSDSEFVLSALAEIFPNAPRTLSEAEEKDIALWLPDLADLSPDDAEALVCWFLLVDDQVRGRKKWPRSRPEFLANYAEAMEKIREWWKATGKAWFVKRQKRKAAKSAKSEDAADPPMDPAEAIKFLNS